jgi:hypothetical protein
MVLDKTYVIMQEEFDMMDMENDRDLKTMEQKMEDEVNPYKTGRSWVVALLNSCLILQNFLKVNSLINFYYISQR